MKINLHVGAHKTATTFIQSVLRGNRKTLNANGFGYAPLRELRSVFTHNLMAYSPDEFRIESLEDSFFGKNRRGPTRGLIISDENLVGACASFIRSGELYSDAAGRLQHLRSLLSGHSVRLFFAIRAYDTFFVSAYCETLRNTGRFVAFAEFRERLQMESCRWPAVLTRVVSALEPDEITIWRYEDFPAHRAEILDSLAFGIQPEIADDERTDVRASFSQAAVDILQMTAERHGTAMADRILHPIVHGLPKDENTPAFYPWSKAERMELAALYEADCARLPATLLGFRPSQPPAAAKAVG